MGAVIIAAGSRGTLMDPHQPDERPEPVPMAQEHSEKPHQRSIQSDLGANVTAVTEERAHEQGRDG